MTDFFKNNPIALRHCLLYEYLRKIPIEKSFIALRMPIGPGIIKKEELQVWFNQFNQGVFDMEDGKEPITDMRDVLRSDKYALRVCILYESLRFKTAERIYSNSHRWLDNLSIHKLRNNPSFFMYNSFCKVIGKNVMKYREFDFWFYRFLDGEFDLNYERNKDKKIYELSDMPIDVMENIVDYLDIFDDSMDTVFEMEQWKQAKCFYMAGNFIWPLHHLYHFVYFQVFLIELSVEDVCQMKEILLKSPNFEKCLIIVDDDTGVHAIEEVFGDYIQQEENTSNDSKIYHYPIPNSSEYFNIDVKGFDFEITRKKR